MTTAVRPAEIARLVAEKFKSDGSMGSFCRFVLEHCPDATVDEFEHANAILKEMRVLAEIDAIVASAGLAWIGGDPSLQEMPQSRRHLPIVRITISVDDAAGSCRLQRDVAVSIDDARAARSRVLAAEALRRAAKEWTSLIGCLLPPVDPGAVAAGRTAIFDAIDFGSTNGVAE